MDVFDEIKPEQPTVPQGDVFDQIQPESVKPLNPGGDFGFGISGYEKGALATVASGGLKSLAAFESSIHEIGKLSGKLLGQDVSGKEWDETDLKKASDLLNKTAGHLDEYAKGKGVSGIGSIPGEVVGGLPVGFVEWGKNIPGSIYAGLDAAAKARAEGKGIWDTTVAGAAGVGKRLVMGKLLDRYSEIKNAVLRRGAGAATFAADTAASGGDLTQTLTSGTVGATMTGKKPERPAVVRPVEAPPVEVKPIAPEITQRPEQPVIPAEVKPPVTKQPTVLSDSVGNEFHLKEQTPDSLTLEINGKPVKVGTDWANIFREGGQFTDNSVRGIAKSLLDNSPGLGIPPQNPTTTLPSKPTGTESALSLDKPTGTEAGAGKIKQEQPRKITQAENDELVALKEKDFTDDGLTESEGKRYTELLRKQNDSKRISKTKEMVDQLQEAGVAIPDNFLHPSEGIENHITGWTRNDNGFIQIRVESHTANTSNSKLITVKSGDTLANSMNDAVEGTTRYRESNSPPPAENISPPQKPPTSPPVAAPGIPEPTPIEATVNKLSDQIKANLKTQKYARKKVGILQSQEKGRRSVAYVKYRDSLIAQGETAGGATARASAKFKGELVSPEDMPKGLAPKLSPEEWDQLYKVSIEKFPEAFRAYKQLNVVEIIGKIKRGEVLQENEIKTVADLFGAKLARILNKQRPGFDRFLTAFADWTGVMTKSIKLGGDVSQTFWNLAPTLYRSPRVWARAVRKGFGSFFSQEQFDAAQKDVKNSPYFVEAIEHGLAQTEMGEFTPRLQREESFPSKLGEKWPLIKQGNRAQVSMGNTARQNLYDLVREQWKKSGVPVTDERLTRLASWVNNLSSRSNIPKGRAVASLFNFLNITMTSPRNVLARVKNVATLFGAINRDPVMAKEGAKTLAGFAATTLAAAVITKIMGADIEVNPLSADFMKAKWGNRRIDLLPGYGPLVRFMTRMVVGETKTAAGHVVEKDRKQIIEQFVKGWRSPLINIVSQVYTGRDYQGQPIEGIGGWTKAAADDFLFLWVMDGVDAFKENSTAQSFLPALGAALPWAGMSWTGINVQTYPESAGTTETMTRDKLSKEQYGKNWEDLNPLQQRRIERTNKAELQAVVTASKVEAAKKNSYDYVGQSIARAKEAGRGITQTLSPESQKALSDLGITIGLEADINKWHLNDERYKRYQELVGEELRNKLDRVTANPNWNSIRQTRREERISDIIKSAKERAGNKIQREARRN